MSSALPPEFCGSEKRIDGEIDPWIQNPNEDCITVFLYTKISLFTYVVCPYELLYCSA